MKYQIYFDILIIDLTALDTRNKGKVPVRPKLKNFSPESEEDYVFSNAQSSEDDLESEGFASESESLEKIAKNKKKVVFAQDRFSKAAKYTFPSSALLEKNAL